MSSLRTTVRHAASVGPPPSLIRNAKLWLSMQSHARRFWSSEKNSPNMMRMNARMNGLSR